jgi:hypothetical protein
MTNDHQSLAHYDERLREKLARDGAAGQPRQGQGLDE